MDEPIGHAANAWREQDRQNRRIALSIITGMRASAAPVSPDAE